MNEGLRLRRRRRRRSRMRGVVEGLVFLVAGGIAMPALSEPQYQVEVIIFQQVLPADAAAGPQSAPAMVDDATAVDPPALPADSLLLKDAVQRLNRSGRYRTLVHVGWRQNALFTQPVRIGDRPGVAETGVSGTASVSVGQQLAMQMSVTCQNGGQTAWLQARRGIRVGELHYVDHRLCGALLQVSRVRDTGE